MEKEKNVSTESGTDFHHKIEILQSSGGKSFHSKVWPWVGLVLNLNAALK